MYWFDVGSNRNKFPVLLLPAASGVIPVTIVVILNTCKVAVALVTKLLSAPVSWNLIGIVPPDWNTEPPVCACPINHILSSALALAPPGTDPKSPFAGTATRLLRSQSVNAVSRS